MSIASVAGGTLLAQAANMMSTQTAMLRISADAEQSVVAMLEQASGQAQAPSQAVTPAAGAGKGAAVDILV
ncbi:hypothetical protein [Rhodospira trueperi]|uniref:Motility protein n=1 Tax=Rhodospira trueperi TaxID=69960 RepID=A0A1G6W790_9PROT|nr:hypothetical protein [Rhodospira trueperi]SDD61800.1 hypothetical protein SAMN05421720_10158 [Rhodospira trueperi]